MRLPGIATPQAMSDIATCRSASADVPRGHPPEFECRGAGCHDRVLCGEVAQGLVVVGLDNRETVRVVVSQDRSEHDHVATFEVRAPVGSMAAHDLPLRVGHSLSEVRTRSDEPQDEGGHAADSTARLWLIHLPLSIPLIRPAMALPSGSGFRSRNQYATWRFSFAPAGKYPARI